MTTLIIPMAGYGSRFALEGYETAKPLLPIGPWRMFEVVLANLFHTSLSKIALVTVEGMISDSDVRRISKAAGCQVHCVELSSRTDGAARTVQLALASLGSDVMETPLVVANSDQYIDASMDIFFSKVASGQSLVLTMEDTDPKWSFVRTDRDLRILEVAEKEVISSQATVGIYGFNSGSSYLEGFNKMLGEGHRVNGELYVAPIYNFLEQDNRGRIIKLGKVGDVMHGLGIPADYESFLQKPVRNVAIEQTNVFFGPK